MGNGKMQHYAGVVFIGKQRNYHYGVSDDIVKQVVNDLVAAGKTRSAIQQIIDQQITDHAVNQRARLYLESLARKWS